MKLKNAMLAHGAEIVRDVRDVRAGKVSAYFVES